MEDTSIHQQIGSTHINDLEDVLSLLFRQRSVSSGQFFFSSNYWMTKERGVPDWLESEFDLVGSEGGSLSTPTSLLSNGKATILFTISDHSHYEPDLDKTDVFRSVSVQIAAASAEVLSEIEKRLRESLPEAEAEEEPDEAVEMNFWSQGPMSPSVNERMITGGAWHEIKDNYPLAVQDGIETLMDTKFRPQRGGQLILWHGPPGSGKTHAIRALTRSWNEWAQFHYITDPETFFGEASYMMQVILSHASEEQWNLLILEDSGELLTEDARERQGQGLSRLLNLVDGMIGQGLRLVVLITTNEPLEKIHPAVSRPGRCISNVEFPKLNKSEAGSWLEVQGRPELREQIEGEEISLAELYALLNSDE